MAMYSKEELAKAKKKVKAKKDFYQHLMAYVIVNFFLFALNMLTTPLTWWFHFPMLGWGIGLAFHYVDVFGIPGFNILSKEWEEKELDQELRKIRREDFSPKAGQGQQAEKDGLELKELRKNYDETDFV